MGQCVFTNGCFDVLHRGHVAYLQEAKSLGESLIIGLNSDASIKRLKGKTRPIVGFEDRAFVLAGLRCVDMVIGFEQDTPAELIKSLLPDVLVKGGDWAPEQIVGADFVLANGGTVRSLPFHAGRSSSGIIETILERARLT